EELARLPEKHRAPLVLCSLEGLTRADAARQLCLPVSTLKSRLEEARARLRSRLALRGPGRSGAVTALALVEGTGQAAIRRALVASTVKAASFILSGGAATGLVSARVAAFTQGVLTNMLFTKLKTAAMVLMAVALLGTGLIVASQRSGPEPP